MSADVVIEARGLVKEYGGRRAVRGIDFTVRAGDFYGFLGPNGAGKTTTIHMLLGIVRKTAGRLAIFGEPMPEAQRRIKQRVGVVPQHDNLDVDLTVLENLLTYASYFGISRRQARARAEELLDFFALASRADDVIESLSGGMRRRLLLARALIHQPRLLILDEPTVGLDPQARQLIWRRLQHLRRQGMTMVLTSHYMEEVARLCNRVLILDHGTVLEQGEPGRLVDEYIGSEVYEIHGDPETLRPVIVAAERCGARREMVPEGMFVYLSGNCDALGEVVRRQQNWLRRPANLEDLFIHLTGRSLRE